MKKSLTWVFKCLSLVTLIFVLRAAFKDSDSIESTIIDVRAGLLVFVAPLLVLCIFQSETIQWVFLIKRALQILKLSNDELLRKLEKHTAQARSAHGYSYVTSISEVHSDFMVQFAVEVYSARFSPEELLQLLSKQIQVEDAQWQAVYATFGFLAKMSPYFGMMATVIGMVNLLKKMSDFALISSNMALAMRGTLYGVVTLLLFYAPMQRFFQDFRNKIFKRNELIAEWFFLIAQGKDPTYIKKELATRFLHKKTINSNAPALHAMASANISPASSIR